VLVLAVMVDDGLDVGVLLLGQILLRDLPAVIPVKLSRLLRIHCERREQLLQIQAAARRTAWDVSRWLARRADEPFELMSACTALIFEDGHNYLPGEHSP
jgi:hypothetical protein